MLILDNLLSKRIQPNAVSILIGCATLAAVAMSAARSVLWPEMPSGFLLLAVSALYALPITLWVLLMDSSRSVSVGKGIGKLQTVINGSDSIFVGLDNSGTITLINQAGCELLGLPENEIVGKNWFENFIPPTHRGQVALVHSLNTNSDTTFVERFENPVKVRNGAIRTILWRNTRQYDARGTLRGIYCSGIDVTDRNRTEVELNQSQHELVRYQSDLQKSFKTLEDYKFALDQAAIVAVTDPQGVITYINDRFCDISGYSPEELLGKDHRILNSGLHPKEFMQNLWETIQSGKVWRGVIRNRRKDGSYYWVATTIVPFLGNNGKPYQHIAIRYDITGEVIEQFRRRKSDARFRTLFRETAFGIALASEHGMIQETNPALHQITGFSGDELAGLPLSVLYGSSLDAPTRPESSSENGSIALYLRKDGTTRWVRRFTTRLPASENVEGGIICFVEDVTTEKAAEQKLLERETLARLGEMAAVIAHEVKNPLAAISGALQVISGRMLEGTTDREVIQNILKRIDTLHSTLGDLLAYARPRPLQKQRVLLMALLKDILRNFSTDPVFRSIRVNISGEDDSVSADPAIIQAALSNLILNAAQAMGASGDMQISIGPVPGELVAVTIQDTGPGIPPEILPRIFDPFYTTKSRGTGLGLPIAKRAAETHGGNLRAENLPGGGVRFTLTLPSG